METKYTLNAERLNQLMDAKGWGPGELATYSGVKYDTIYKIRNSERERISAEIVAKLAVALQTSMEYLLGMTDKKAPIALDINPTMLKIVEVGKRLSKARQRDLLKLAKSYESQIEEDQRQFYQDVRDLIFERADEAGLGNQVDQFLKSRLDELMNGDDLPGPSEDDDEDDTGKTK